MAQKDNRILELDVLRGIAAIAVVIYHNTWFIKHEGPAFNYGKTGVELFFMISGFVIFMSIGHVKKGSDFVVNRVARLYPAYWLCVSFTFGLQLCNALLYPKPESNLHLTRDYLVNLTMFQYYFKVQDLDGPYWTLIIEMVFYIFMLFLFSIKKLQKTEAIGATMLLIIFVLQQLNVPTISGLTTTIFHYIPMLTFWGLFLSGIVFYKIYTEKGTYFRYLLLAACFGFELTQYDIRKFHDYLITFPEYVVILALYYGIFLMFINNKLSFIVSRPTVFLGKISYSLYLVHAYFSIEFFLPLLYHKLHINYWLCLLINIPLVVVMAWLINTYIENPYRRKLRDWLSGKVARS